MMERETIRTTGDKPVTVSTRSAYVVEIKVRFGAHSVRNITRRVTARSDADAEDLGRRWMARMIRDRWGGSATVTIDSVTAWMIFPPCHARGKRKNGL